MGKKIIPILKKHDVVKAGLFGSFARGDFTKKSDVDVLVKFKGRKSYFDLVGLEMELEESIGRKFDLVTYKYIYLPIKKRILNEEVKLI